MKMSFEYNRLHGLVSIIANDMACIVVEISTKEKEIQNLSEKRNRLYNELNELYELNQTKNNELRKIINKMSNIIVEQGKGDENESNQ